MRITRSRSLAGVLLAVQLAACGGGGDGASAPPPVNRPPVAKSTHVHENPTLVVGHRLDFDTLFGGEPYLDPDGDSLKYKLTIEGGVTWNGLSAVGTRIVGTPPEPLGGSAQLLVEDGRGGRLQVLFALAVVPNQPPQVASPLEDRIVDVGAPLDIDVRGNPAAFSDEAADALTYQITFKSAAPGLAVQGNRVVGALDSSSVVFVKVQARDILGETAE